MKRTENEQPRTTAKSTGIIRKIDELGRVVVPMSIRQTLGLNERDPVEIFVEGERIILQKQQCTCVFCGGTEELTLFAGKNVCASCLNELKKN